VGIVLVVIAAVVAGLLALAFLAWFLGWDTARRIDPLRASATEAGERTADGIAEFWDWLRLGR
jgi:hypothetical protein